MRDMRGAITVVTGGSGVRPTDVSSLAEWHRRVPKPTHHSRQVADARLLDRLKAELIAPATLRLVTDALAAD